MKKLLYAMRCLCLIVSITSCSTDDFIEILNTKETQEEEIIDLPPAPLENGDNNGDETKGKKD